MPLLSFHHESEITLTLSASPAVLQRWDRGLDIAEKLLTFLETPPPDNKVTGLGATLNPPTPRTDAP